MFSLSFIQLFFRSAALPAVLLFASCGGGAISDKSSTTANPAVDSVVPGNSKVSGTTQAVSTIDITIAQPNVYPGRAFALSASVNPSDVNAWIYTWAVAGKNVGTSPLISTVLPTPRTYEVALSATNTAGVKITKYSPVFVQQSTISEPAVVISDAVTVGVASTFSATGAADSSGGTVSYLWKFGDGTEQEGSSVSHTYTRIASYIVSLVVRNDLGVKSDAISRTISVNPAPVAARVSIITSAASDTTFTQIGFTASVSNSQQVADKYTWSFGDGAFTVVDRPTVNHIYLVAENYVVTVRAQNSQGLDVSTTLHKQILSNTLSTCQLVPACSRVNCAAKDASTYAGSGFGVWRYTNDSTSEAIVNLNISGVVAGKEVTLVFSNGAYVSAPTAPNLGVFSSGVIAADSAVFSPNSLNEKASKRARLIDASHLKHIESESQIMREMRSQTQSRRRTGGLSTSGISFDTAAAIVPVVGMSKKWNDLFPSKTTPKVVSTSARAICMLASGRRLVIWGDVSAPLLTDDYYRDFAKFACGETPDKGAVNKLNALLGDFWSVAAANKFDYVITETASAQQDVNIVLEQSPGSGWAGYFSRWNNI